MEIKVTSPLTKQQLLIPRVLCIGTKEGEPNYPDSPFCVGDILTYLDGMYFDKDNNCGISTYDIIGFPHLFSLLQWWEKRKVNDLPQYVKDENGEVWKVTKYFIDSSVACFYTGELEKEGWLKGTETPFNLLAVEPADEAEYQEYQKQKQ